MRCLLETLKLLFKNRAASLCTFRCNSLYFLLAQNNQFAPRYKDIQATISRNLYGFQHPSHYEELLIKPVRKINTELIMKEWDNIKRIMGSLALKTTTQNVIVRKLSSYARKNQTKRVLWEYDNIIKSLYF
ncbi:hypothetical protein BK706_10380 [Bacillus thuringiensis serovar leesis]|nr:hypothetical protein BK706_10380 [Bacillus thuringiensis serovar leesis]